MPRLCEALLPFTIRNAVRLRFYAQAWNGIDIDAISSPKELCKLPTLSKQEYRSSLMLDDQAGLETAYITHTTGTTGPLTWRHRSLAEAAVIHQLFGSVTEGSSKEFALTFRYDHHGMSMPVPGRVRSMPIGLTDEAELKQCVQLLTGTYRFADDVLRPTIVAGSAHDVALLAQAWLEAGAPGDVLAVHTLHLLGFVDLGLYSFLTSAFKDAHIIERYSLTEIFGGATRRWPSTSFVLDPHVIGEVVDEGGAPVTSGTAGELVLTELFPFVQMQPLIRYRTGDVVLLLDDHSDNLQFEWWGRRDNCVLERINGTSTWILGYRPLADWLSLQRLVSRQAHRTGLSSLTSTDFGPPCLKIDKQPDRPIVRIEVGLRVNPWWAQDAVRELAQGVWSRLQSMATSLEQSLSVCLSFRHVPSPTDDFSATTSGAALQFPPRTLSCTSPLFEAQPSSDIGYGGS